MFEKDRFQDMTDQQVMQQTFKQKQQRYQSLLTKESPILFKADKQEIQENDRVFVLSGHVSIRKDDFELLADYVRIEQFTGDVIASGNVEMKLAKDILTGESAFYNFYTGTGWIRNARAVIEPSLFVEGELLEKLPDYDLTGKSQYALTKGFVSACSGKTPDWQIRTQYAVVRLENYAHMNQSSFWISRVPIFYMPYWFYPTKSDRATGLLIPNIGWSSRRGAMLTEEFFWVWTDSMDATFGATYYTRLGLEETVQWRNAFDQYTRGEMNVDHIKEENSPSLGRNPQERWQGKCEQTILFPLDLRGTVNLDFRSDQDFERDYGSPLQDQATQFMESRMSLTKYWNVASLTLDGTYEKDFDQLRDETVQHIPRLEYYSGWQPIIGSFKGSLRLRTEALSREGKFTSFGTMDDGNEMRVVDWFVRDGTRSLAYSEIWYEYDDVAWFNLTPWVGLEEAFWDQRKTLDPDHPDGSWATYPEPLPPLDNTFYSGIYSSGDWLRREIFSCGLNWNGPKFYRIYPLLGYKNLSKIKHLIEPEITFSAVPDLDQTEIIEYDNTDHRLSGHLATISLTNRFLAKFKAKKQGDSRHSKNANSTGESSEPMQPDSQGSDASISEITTDSSSAIGSESDPFHGEGGIAADSGVVREFARFSISQSYDFLKADQWDTREPAKDEVEERIQYPVGNLKFDTTVNPFNNVYLSARTEYDPFFHSFSNGYLYGHFRTKTGKLGIRWDYTKNFLNTLFDLHALALEGGYIINDQWSFASWVKYDFTQNFFPYTNLDITYSSQCWALTLHTYYSNDRLFLGPTPADYQDDREMRFSLSIKLKNLDTVDSRSFGGSWWSGD